MTTCFASSSPNHVTKLKQLLQQLFNRYVPHRLKPAMSNLVSMTYVHLSYPASTPTSCDMGVPQLSLLCTPTTPPIHLNCLPHTLLKPKFITIILHKLKLPNMVYFIAQFIFYYFGSLY